jgi:hypothetical protein
MTNPLNNIKKEAQAVRLSSSEKEAMRARIFELASASKRAQAARRSGANIFYIFHQRFAAALAALMLVVFAGGGTAYAAQGALPGEALYPVKIYVNENVQGALAISPQAKVSYNTSIAQTRLQEAQMLAAQGRLDATTSAQIESNLNQHIQQADAIAASLAQQDPAAGIEASVNLDSSLAAQGSILASLGGGSSDVQTQINSDAIAAQAIAQGDAGVAAAASPGDAVVATAATAPAQAAPPSAAPAVQVQILSVSVSASATSSSSSDAQPEAHRAAPMMKAVSEPQATTTPGEPASSTQDMTIATALAAKAQSDLQSAHRDFANTQASLDATTAAKASGELSDLDASMATGTAQMSAGDYTDARATFTAVIRQSIQLSAFVDAGKTFKKDFFRSAPSNQH